MLVEPHRIVTLLEPYICASALSAAQLNNISTYVNILTRWNARTNLTAIRDEDAIVRRHFGESLFAAKELVGPDAEIDVIDVGSGAGFPGFPLKIYAPGIALTLVESHGKKATFLREVARALGLKGVTVLEKRAEQVDAKAGLVTFRAVEKFESILLAAAELVASGGRLGILVGSGQVARASELLGGAWEEMAVPESESRVLAVWRKV